MVALGPATRARPSLAHRAARDARAALPQRRADGRALSGRGAARRIVRLSAYARAPQDRRLRIGQAAPPFQITAPLPLRAGAAHRRKRARRAAACRRPVESDRSPAPAVLALERDRGPVGGATNVPLRLVPRGA